MVEQGVSLKTRLLKGKMSMKNNSRSIEEHVKHKTIKMRIKLIVKDKFRVYVCVIYNGMINV